MGTATVVQLMDMTAGALADAEMPADPFEAAEVLEAGKHLAAELVRFMARTRAQRVANRDQWAAHTAAVRAAFDPEGMPPPPPPPPPPTEPVPPAQDDPPPSQPPSDRGGS